MIHIQSRALFVFLDDRSCAPSNSTTSKNVVLEYASNGEMGDHILRVGRFDLEVSRFYMAELVLACEMMHR